MSASFASYEGHGPYGDRFDGAHDYPVVGPPSADRQAGRPRGGDARVFDAAASTDPPGAPAHVRSEPV